MRAKVQRWIHEDEPPATNPLLFNEMSVSASREARVWVVISSFVLRKNTRAASWASLLYARLPTHHL